MSGASVRVLTTLDEFAEAAQVLSTIWGSQPVTRELLRALAWAGSPVIGAFDAHGMIGVTAGFVGLEGGLHLHSHITGVLPGREHAGIGYDLKLAQQRWCLERGVERVTWTFDPMIARNAYFNMSKLGATAEQFLPNFYGTMHDEINQGEEADRLEAVWLVGTARVAEAMGGSPPATPEGAHAIAVPDDYVALRHSDPAAARSARLRVREEMLAAFADGLIVVGFVRGRGYILAPPA